MPEGRQRPTSALRAGLLCRCPRCGEGRLFAGYLTVAPSCPHCGLDLSAHDSGDGPAVFVILVVGFAVVALALIMEVRFGPPTWVHLVIEIPLILAASLGLLRPFKATFIALQFKHRAGERPFADEWED